MCDTLVATRERTAGGVVLFGKNSDRQRNEAQATELLPRATHPHGATVSCTYMAIPQVAQTHAALISRPCWIWGAEMGANEHGLVVANEGVHARAPAPREKALIGMDLVRLALERAETAEEGVEVVTRLLEQYGQGGDCGHLTPNYYQNGFLVADAREAFVLETVGREWMLERVSGVRSMSNVYSIGRNACRVSSGLHELIRNSRWSDAPGPDYAAVIADPNREHIGQAGARRARSTALLRAREGTLDVAGFMSILRDHGPEAATGWHPARTSAITLCMHAGAEDRPGQSVASMVSEIATTGAVHWLTGTAAPCISIFKPVFVDVPLPFEGARPSDRFNPYALWWRHEWLHRRVLMGDFAAFLEGIRAERDALEAEFQRRVHAVLKGGDASDRAQVVAQCWREAEAAESRWAMESISKEPISQAALDERPYLAKWLETSRLAGMPD